MVNNVFLMGMILFAISSVYFLFFGRIKNGLNSAFLVSFITLISYAIMWQGGVSVTTISKIGEPIMSTRWLFYGVSCTLLMLEILKLKGIKGEKLVELLYLTVIVMFTGFLAARDLTLFKWIYFAISSVAYILLIMPILAVKSNEGRWINTYIFFGWTLFPIVFFIAPEGLGLISAMVANLLYLALDFYTKIIFNIQLKSKS